ncbi:MAG: heme-copper oxidase subunit III [Ktedonobacteraceae bacterium]|nr:heme-copper oxidase subunit III [Ktedonobacteraceae bacterium]
MSAAHGEQVRILEEHHVEEGRSVNWWGMIFFIASEALIFANLIAAYLYLEIRGLQAGQPWVLPNGEALDFIYPLINTFILLSSSGTAIIAMRGVKRGNWRWVAGWLTVTMVLGLIFLGGQAYEYTNLFSQGFTLSSAGITKPLFNKAFGSAFFTLTGFHGLHVTVGIIFLLIVIIRTLRGHFNEKKHFAVEAVDMYWHFVDLVWVFVFSTVYLLPLLMGGK